jgi:hypothetical protein
MFRVRSNLYYALKVLRHESSYCVLWVDAVCIDQSHNAERGQQVSQMGRIYSNATEIRIWLGGPDKYSDLAMDSIEEIVMEFNNSGSGFKTDNQKFCSVHDPLDLETLPPDISFILYNHLCSVSVSDSFSV